MTIELEELTLCIAALLLAPPLIMLAIDRRWPCLQSRGYRPGVEAQRTEKR